MKRAMILGRFQPPHAGHLHAIRAAADKYDEVLVVVGSAQESYTLPNPFTAGERVEMLDAALDEAGIQNVRVFPLADINRHAQWVAYVDSQIPPYDVVVANNPLTHELFTRAGYRVEPVKMHRRDECSGTTIRQLLAQGQDVGDRAPPAVKRILERIDAADRVRALSEGDRDG